MYKSKHIIEKHNGTIRWFSLFLVALILFCGVLSLFNYPPPHVSADTNSSERKLQNGSFEEEQTWTSSYKQPNQSAVPSWNTTAKGELIELFRENTGTYVSGVTLKPTNGSYAAELNADEESTLYQNVKTSPSSVYEWGLDHGARNGTDTMALIIGPKQTVNPSKPSKDGRDQLMQMVDWLIEQGETSVKTSAGLGEKLIVYSKKFATDGTFEDNAGNNAFSLTPSTIYTEEWHIWIMASSRATSGNNPWNSYGSNDESIEDDTGDTGLDLNKYYLYTVPAGQTETLFGFVSVGVYKTTAPSGKEKTYGNFLDNINFQLYHPLSGSTTTHGSAVIGGSDGTTEGEGNSDGYQVTIDNKLTTYVMDGELLKIQAVVKKEDADDGCEFVGVYHTNQDENGNPVTEFLRLSGNEIEDSESLTDEDKVGKWIKSTNDNGDIIYTYYLEELTSATDLHFVFIKSPTVTYDPNGGKPYLVARQYNTDEAPNVYSFKPDSGNVDAEAYTETLFIEPYVSHAAEGQNDGWKFMGWLLTGDIVDDVSTDIQVNADQLGSLILPAEHTIACDYAFAGINGDSKVQYFKIYDGSVALTKNIDENATTHEDFGVIWTDNGEEKVYANVHKGLTMMAQWRWRQAFIPQKLDSGTYINSAEGGTVEITSVTDILNDNYNADYNENGGKSYYAETDEKITVTAIANEKYSFIGWYDENGNLVSTNTEYTYVETKEGVNTFYARFSDNVTQTYIRQVWNGNSWQNVTDTNDTTIGTLGRYTYTDAVGMPISSTAIAGSGYKFIGWYDSEYNKVGEDMLTNNGATISYTTTGNATYYARFEATVTQTYIRQIKDGDSWKTTTDDTIGKLTLYSHIDVVGKNVSSKATEGIYYNFVGWYDSSGNPVSDEMLTNNGTTISYTTTGDATYYARFSKKTVIQTFIRQIKDGESWVDTTNDTIGTLLPYSHEGEVLQSVSSTATSGDGYQFVGWYDSDYNKVADEMLAEDDVTTISYTTTGNATYYARFEKIITQTYVRQIKDGESWIDTNDDEIGTLSNYSHTDVADVEVSSTATAGDGYRFVGWYNSEGTLITTDKTITHTIMDGAIYYARFEKACTLNVSKIDGDKSTNDNKVPLADVEFTLYQEDDSGDTIIVYDEVNIKCTSVDVAITTLNDDETKATAIFKDMLFSDRVYYLAETKAPTGYRLLDTPLKITFDESDNILINGISKPITNNEVNIELANYLTLQMPTSGTSFTDGWFAVVGLSLLALATIGLFWIKISRYKQK